MKLPNYPDPIGKTHTEGEHAIEDLPKDDGLIISTIKAFLWMGLVIVVVVGSIFGLMWLSDDSFASSDTEHKESVTVKDFIPKDWTMGNWNVRYIQFVLGDGNKASMYTLHQRSEETGYMAFICMTNTETGKPLFTHPERWGMEGSLKYSAFALHIASEDNKSHVIHAPHDRYDLVKYLDYFDGNSIAIYPVSDGKPDIRIKYDGDGFSRAVQLFRSGCGVD